jgi:hypothetical protein
VAFRFRRRISIPPGLRLNISRSGISTSVGRRGLWVTYGRGRLRTTVGLPGSGLSYTSTSEASGAAAPRPSGTVPSWMWWLLVLLLIGVLVKRLAHLR